MPGESAISRKITTSDDVILVNDRRSVVRAIPGLIAVIIQTVYEIQYRKLESQNHDDKNQRLLRFYSLTASMITLVTILPDIAVPACCL